MRDSKAASASNTTTRRHAMRSIGEAARDVGVPEVTIRRWIVEGELFVIRIGPSALVDLGEVRAVRDRLMGDAAGRRRPFSRRVYIVIGVGDLIAGVIGILLFVGLGSNDLRSLWMLGLSLFALAVGVALLWFARSALGRGSP